MSTEDLREDLTFALKFDGTGSTLTDWKSGKTGTLIGATQNNTGPGSNGIKSANFDGVTDYAEFTNAALGGVLNASTGNMSNEFWFKTTSTGARGFWGRRAAGSTAALGARQISVGGNFDNYFVYNILTIGAPGSIPIGVGTTTSTVVAHDNSTSAIHLNDGVWHQCVMTVDRTNAFMTLYIDGIPSPISPNGNGKVAIDPGFTIFDSTGSLILGGRQNNALAIIERIAENLALFNVWIGRVLTPSEVSELWNNGNGLDLSENTTTLPGLSASIPSDSIKHVLNSARFKGSTVLDTTNEVGKDRVNDISTLRDTILSIMKATSKANVHVNTSAGKKLKAIAALNPATATAADIINTVRNS